jgi:hypothetical protein
MKEVVSVASEAELAGLFHNGKEACPIRTCIAEVGHPQPPTPLKTDNTTAEGLANDSVQQKRSKAIDMRFYWIRDRVRQKQFHVYWRKAEFNRADYFTKHHATKHHHNMRHKYLHQSNHARTTNLYAQLTVYDCCDTDPTDTSSDANVTPPQLQNWSFEHTTGGYSDTYPLCEGV